MLGAAKDGLPLGFPRCGKLLFDCQLIQRTKLVREKLDTDNVTNTTADLLAPWVENETVIINARN